MQQILFEDVALFDGIEGDRKEGYSVLVEGERIKEVSDQAIKTSEAITLSLAGATLMPGLIDAHFHCVAAHPNFSEVEAMPASLLHQHAREILEQALMRGFTTIRDAGGADYGHAMAVKSGLIKGPRIFYAGRALTQTGGHADFRGRQFDGLECCACAQRAATVGVIADGVPEVRRAAREELRKGATQIKMMASGGVASPSDPVWNLQYSEEEIRAIVWEAKSWRTYVMAHAYTPEAIHRCVAYGVHTIEHANLIDAETAAFCRDQGAWVVPTLATYDALKTYAADLGFPAESLAKVDDVALKGRESLDILKNAGTNIGFGTDLLGAMHAHQATEFLIRREVLSAEEVLLSATSGNAKMMNVENELGVVKPGALADLILVAGDPLADFDILQHQGAHIPVIMKGGTFFKNELA